MINLVLPVPPNAHFLQDWLSKIALSAHKDEICVWLLAEKNNIQAKKVQPPEHISVVLHAFSVGSSTEDMLAEALTHLPSAQTIILRPHCNFFSTQNLDNLIDAGQQADIALFQAQKYGKVRGAFQRALKKLCKFFLNITFFDGSVAFMSFSARATTILRECGSAQPTKLFKFVGLSTKYILLDSTQPSPKTLKTPPAAKLALGTCAFFAAGSIIATIFLLVLGILKLLTFLACVAGVIISFTALCHQTLAYFCLKHIGQLHTKKTEVWERRIL